jgi:hypothetical protein
MALLIQKNVTVLGDINLSQLYVRLTTFYGPGGSPVNVRSNVFSSKNSYELNQNRNSFFVEGIPAEITVDYNRASNGSDLLTYVHNKFKEVLTTDIMALEAVLDPSTGVPMLDPSTGEALMQEFVFTPKFTQDSSVSLIDID